MSSPRQEEPRRDDKMSLIVAIIGIFISIIVATVSLLTSSIPTQIFYPLALAIVVCALALLIGVLYGPASRFLRARSLLKRYDEIAKWHYGEFREFVDRFSELSDERMGKSVSKDLGELSRAGIQGFQRVFILPTFYIQYLITHFRAILDNVYCRKETFVTVTEIFDDIIRIYNNFSVFKPIEEIRMIGRDKVPENIRETYNDDRVIYVRFLEEYVDFIKKMNKEFRKDLLRVPYYETPKEL
mgnify:CR=1 FL=1